MTIIESEAFNGCNLERVLFTGTSYPKLKRFTFDSSPLYVIDGGEARSSFGYDITNSVIEYITFPKHEFDYTGQGPIPAFINNLDEYDLTMPISGTQKDVGTYEITFKATYSNGMELEIPYAYTINKAPLTINVNNSERIYGEQNPMFTYSVTGFVNNENESVFDSPIILSTTAGVTSNAGTYAINAKGEAKNYEFKVNEGTLTVKKAPLTVKANEKTKMYGDANPQFDFSYAGLKNGETVPVMITDFTTSTEASPTSNVGEYSINVSGGVSTNYEFTEYVSGKLTIIQAPLTITAQSTMRTYGDDNPVFQYSYSGFRNQDTEECFTTQPQVITEVDKKSEVGTYTIVPSGAVATNYNISYGEGTLTVKEAPLMIQANNVTRLYGDDNPTFTFSYQGFKNGETEEVLTTKPTATSEGKTKEVGHYDIVPSNASAKNYTINYTNGTLSITKAPLIVIPNDASRLYGDKNPMFTVSYEGFKNDENADVISIAPSLSTDALQTSGVGEYTITANGGKADNYEFVEYRTGRLDITKASLNIKAENVIRVYGEENPVFKFVYAGFKNDDTEADLQVVPQVVTEVVPTSNVGTYTIVPSGAEAKNYNISYTEGTLTVDKALLIIQADNVARTYGDENPIFTFSYQGFKNNETEDVLTAQPTATSVDKGSDVGTYDIVTNGADARNYAITYGTGKLTIEKALLNVTPIDTKKVYGDVNPQINLSYNGFKNDDTESDISIEPSILTNATRQSNVGEYKITLNGGVARNYTFEYGMGTLTIEKAPLTLIVDDASKIYFDENPEFTFHGDGFKNSDTKDVLTIWPTFNCSAQKMSGVGEYEITAEGAVAENYEISYQSGKLSIEKRTVEITVANYSRIYNEENPEFTLTYSGFVNNEKENVLTKLPVIQCGANKQSDTGTYPIVASGAEAVNYRFDYHDGILTIEKALQEILWEQDLSNISVGSQILFTAIATSGLPVEYEFAENNLISVYEINGQLYVDCGSCGEVLVKAIQSGNKNYHSALRVYKTLVITDPSGIRTTTTVNRLVDVYTLQGVMVKSQISVENIEKELPTGIYIINGKKVVIK